MMSFGCFKELFYSDSSQYPVLIYYIPLPLLIASRPARNPLATFSALSTAQKCIKYKSGDP